MLNTERAKNAAGLAPARVLVVDDEPEILDIIRVALNREGLEVLTSYDGTGALELARYERIDLMILDLGLPDIDGMAVCTQVRALGGIRILILTARDETRDIVRGLQLGADDYVVKPFRLEELIARVRAVLRRRTELSASTIYSEGDLILDPSTHQVERAGRTIELTPTEFRLLEFLMRNAPRILEKDRIVSAVWREEREVVENVLDVYVSRLRKKLGEPNVLQTVRGIGLMIRSPA